VVGAERMGVRRRAKGLRELLAHRVIGREEWGSQGGQAQPEQDEQADHGGK